MALTTARLDGAECLDLGLASHYLPSNALSGVKAAIASQPHYIDQLLRTSDVVAPPARIDRNRPHIARLFASDRLADILAALARSEARRVGKGCVSTCRSGWSP